MHVSHSNNHGVLPAGYRETLGFRGYAHAIITIALCDDALFRYGLEMMYSHGGLGVPITVNDHPFPSLASARMAAIQAMLCHWPQPFPSDPTRVHQELQYPREQLECHLRQPSLF